MSEIKGQILGVVLVLAIFGAIAGTMISMFKDTADGAKSQLNEDLSSINNHASLGSLTF